MKTIYGNDCELVGDKAWDLDAGKWVSLDLVDWSKGRYDN